MTGDNRFIKLTPLREEILRLCEGEGVISASDVARDLIRGRNERTAKSQLKVLRELGLLTPVRTCEFILSETGRAWLDNHRRPL